MASKISLGRSTSWSLASYGVKTGMRFASNMILSRLLSPEMFGIAAIGNAILNGVTMFSDIGLRPGIVRSHRDDAVFFETAWSLQLLRGILLCVLLLLMALPIGYLYGSSEVTTFILIIAFSQLAMGLNNVEINRLYRDSSLTKPAIFDITAAIVGLSAMVGWAIHQPSSVALAVGALVSTAAYMSLSFFFLPTRYCRFRIDREAAHELISFGKWIFISTMFAFFEIQLDRLALGKLIPLELLGFYSIASIWANIPSQVLGQWSGQVFFPLVAESVRNNSGSHMLGYARRVYVVIAALASVLIFAISDLLISLVYPHSYAGVAPLLRLLTGVALLAAVEQSYSDLLIAHSRPKDKLIGQGISLVIFLALLWPVFKIAGLDGFIYLLGATSALRCLWFAFKLRPYFKLDVLFDAICFVSYVAAGYALYQLNNVSRDQLYQLSMAFSQAVAAALLSFWLYRTVSKRHVASQAAS